MEWIVESVAWFASLIENNFSAITGLLGVFVGGWLVNSQNQSQRRIEFYKDQLNRFYSPMVGIRKEIGVLSEFRLASEKASRDWWQKVCQEARSIEEERVSKEHFEANKPKIKSKIDYENTQLETKLIPAYRQMLEIFKNNYWLAEEETRLHFSTLVKYVETWNRFLSETHAVEIIEQINVPEEELDFFYDDIEKKLDNLRAKIKHGKI